jgi:hypothetical protein
MGIDHDVWVGTVSDQSFKDLFHISTFIGSRVQFAVAVGARAAFAKTIIAFGIDAVLFMDGREITTTCPDIFAPFDHDWFDA